MAWIAARRRALHYARAGKCRRYQRSAKGGRWKTKRRRLEARAAWEVLGLKTLNGFCCRRSGIGDSGLRKRTAPAGFLLGALVDLDGAFEIGAVFDHDARGGQVADDRAILLDFDTVLGAKIALHVTVDHHFAGNDVGGHLRGGANGQLPLVELDQSFDRAVDLQIFVARNFAFHVQAGPEPRGCTVGSRTQWTQSICTHRGFSLPSRRSGLRRLIDLRIFLLRLRGLRHLSALRRLSGLRRFRFLIPPHRSSRDGSTPRRFPAGVEQTLDPRAERGKYSVR